MIVKLMQIMAPKGVLGFISRLLLFVGIVTLANIAFNAAIGGKYHPTSYYVGHALFVGGPLIAFFLAVTVFQMRLQRKLWRLSRKDTLTGLNNRHAFFENTERVRDEKAAGVLLLLDADRFKHINDTYGHQAGDACLRSIAYAIRRSVRKGDVVGRIGGEEFAVYLRDTTAGQARVIGERLTLPITFKIGNDIPLSVTLSIGAVTALRTDTMDTLFSKADRALYQAKCEGRARMVFAAGPLAA